MDENNEAGSVRESQTIESNIPVCSYCNRIPEIFLINNDELEIHCACQNAKEVKMKVEDFVNKVESYKIGDNETCQIMITHENEVKAERYCIHCNQFSCLNCQKGHEGFNKDFKFVNHKAVITSDECKEPGHGNDTYYCEFCKKCYCKICNKNEIISEGNENYCKKCFQKQKLPKSQRTPLKKLDNIINTNSLAEIERKRKFCTKNMKALEKIKNHCVKLLDYYKKKIETYYSIELKNNNNLMKLYDLFFNAYTGTNNILNLFAQTNLLRLSKGVSEEIIGEKAKTFSSNPQISNITSSIKLFQTFQLIRPVKEEIIYDENFNISKFTTSLIDSSEDTIFASSMLSENRFCYGMLQGKIKILSIKPDMKFEKEQEINTSVSSGNSGEEDLRIIYIEELDNDLIVLTRTDNLIIILKKSINDVGKVDYKEYKRCVGHTYWVMKATRYAKNKIISCSYDKTVRFWDLDKEDEVESKEENADKGENKNKSKNKKGGEIIFEGKSWVESILFMKDNRLVIALEKEGLFFFRINEDNNKSFNGNQEFKNCLEDAKFVPDINCCWNKGLIQLKDERLLCSGRQKVWLFDASRMVLEETIVLPNEILGRSLSEISNGNVIVGCESGRAFLIRIYRRGKGKKIEEIKTQEKGDILSIYPLGKNSFLTLSANIKLWQYKDD